MTKERYIILGIGKPYTYQVEQEAQSEDEQEWEFITIAVSELMHFQVHGKSGYGKSYWLASLIVMLITKGVAVSLVDPAGDLYDLVLRQLVAIGYFDRYPDAFERLICLNVPAASQQERYFAYNVLENGYTPGATAALVVEAFKRAVPTFPAGTAINIETLLRSGAHVLAENNLPLLPYLSYLYKKPSFRARLLSKVTDAEVRNSFEEYGFTRNGKIPESMKPTVKRINLFSLPVEQRYCFGQKENILDFRKLLAKNQSVLLNLNTTEPETMRLLGSFYSVYAELGAKQRGQDRSTPHVLIEDEFQNVVAQSGVTFGKIAEECRKFKLFLGLSHQHWEQVPPELRGALRQSELVIAFRLEEKDAEISRPLLRFPYKPFLRKPSPTQMRGLGNGALPAPQYYSRSEQERMNLDDITNLPKQEAFIRLPKRGLYRMRSLLIDEQRVDKKRVEQVEAEYLRLYFTAASDIQADITRTLYSIDPSVVDGNDTIEKDEQESQDDTEGEGWDVI